MFQNKHFNESNDERKLENLCEEYNSYVVIGMAL